VRIYVRDADTWKIRMEFVTTTHFLDRIIIFRVLSDALKPTNAGEKRGDAFLTARRPLKYSTEVLDLVILVAHRNG
jgi:hypothetical protein